MLQIQLRARTVAYTVAAVFLTLLVALRQRSHLTDVLIDELIQASTPTGVPFKIPPHLNSAGNDFRSAHHDLYDSYPVSNLSSILQHLEPILHCAKPPDPTTGHIRLPRNHHHNISLHAPGSDHDPSTRHFNPTIIPLPSYVASFTPARYLLVTRLVTPGLHQESLACLATFCLPHPDNRASSPDTNGKTNITTDSHIRTHNHLPPDTHPCPPHSLSPSSTLGPNGGLRCITAPRHLNIPPTPAKHCTGSWASFPDIPGFHDPRIMWSNLGEPLIVVNSASQYGCVGLWVVDLRVLVPELAKVMERRSFSDDGDGNGDRSGPGGARAWGEKQAHKHARKDVPGDRSGRVRHSQPVIRYRAPTELTRWEGREEVEKNWILWFPGQEGEAWVSYELFGTWKRKSAEEGAGTEAALNASQNDGESRHERPPWHQAMPSWPALNFSDSNGTWHANSSLGPDGRANWNASSFSLDADHEAVDRPSATTSRKTDTMTSYTALIPTTTATSASAPAPTNAPQPAKRFPSSNRPSPPSPPPSASTPKGTLPVSNPSLINTPNRPTNANAKFHNGGRHISRLLSHGFTSPNLTSASEPPCLLPADSLDAVGREGHWHQSTPALRVRLCYRSVGGGERGGWNGEGRAGRVCGDGYGVGDREGAQGTREAGAGDDGGAGDDEVFFAVVHRKFSDESLGMPLRYERFAVVWEPRYPFRVLGVGKGPVVFGGEVVRGFGAEYEQGGAGGEGEMQEEEALRRDRELMREVGFTYTTSIAWAWRPVGAEEDGGVDGTEDAEHLGRLGTGYLGDEVIVGVGLDDVAQMVVRVKVEELLGCLRLCPGIRGRSEQWLSVR